MDRVGIYSCAEIGAKVFEIYFFFNFPDGNWPPRWIIKSAKFYLKREGVWRTKPCHHAEFCWNLSIHRGDIAIFRFLKMAAATILNFWIHEILLYDWVHRSKKHHPAKFRQNRPICCRDLQFFKMDIRNCEILLADGVQRAKVHYRARFSQNR